MNPVVGLRRGGLAFEPQAAVVVADDGRRVADRTLRVGIERALDEGEQAGVVEHGKTSLV